MAYSYSGAEPLSTAEAIFIFIVCFIIWSPILLIPIYIVAALIQDAAKKVLEEGENIRK